nr:hypothetical protein [uncultured Mucilaginibacter sp.]
MKRELMKQYWRYYSKSFVISLVIYAVLAYYLGPSFFFFFFLACARDYYHSDAKLFEINRLKARGLTEEDADNIRFVKKWEQTRAEGRLSFCLFDGGVVQGGIIALLLCLIAISVYGVQTLFAEPSYMFLVTGGAYLVGWLIASFCYLFLWKLNERRFKQLTQFDHIIS